VLEARELPVVDSFEFFGFENTPASVSFRVEWSATGEFAQRGSGAGMPDPTHPAAFSGQIAVASSTGEFSGSELGFGFQSELGAGTTGGYAQIGRERNGVYLTPDAPPPRRRAGS
jgi:hypothetical protein